MPKQYAVLGLSRFGESIAVELQKLGCYVVVVDRDEAKVDLVKDKVSYAMIADVQEAGVLESIGISNYDGVIVAIGSNMEASIMATLIVKEMGVFVIAAAKNRYHGKVLKKIGADSVIFPEREYGSYIAKRIMSTDFASWIDLSEEYSLIEKIVPAGWVGKTLAELNVREKYGINIVGTKKADDRIEVNPDPHAPLTKEMILIMIGANTDLEKV